MKQGKENIEEVVDTKVFVVESGVWQLIDLLGKDKGTTKKVAKVSNLSAWKDGGETQSTLGLYKSNKLYQC